MTHPEAPKLITSISGVAGVQFGHTFTPTPDGKFAVAETEYQYAPLRIFDLRPGLEGKVQAITEPIGAWTADWHDLSHNHEVRWPFVFVSAYEDGLQVFNMVDRAHPQTVGWYYTCECKHEAGFGGLPQWEGHSVMQGAFGVKIRNSDGLLIISDSNTGFWAFRMDGFNGWNGNDWGCRTSRRRRIGIMGRRVRGRCIPPRTRPALGAQRPPPGCGAPRCARRRAARRG